MTKKATDTANKRTERGGTIKGKTMGPGPVQLKKLTASRPLESTRDFGDVGLKREDEVTELARDEFIVSKAKSDWIEKDEKIIDEIELGSNWSKSSYELFADKILTFHAIQRGLSYKSFERIYKQSPFTQAFWAEALGLSIKSLNRYKQTGKKFKPLQSEKIIELAEVSDMGRKVFESDEDFELWLNTPSVALGHNKPIDLIKNSYGKELVLTELINIDQGIFV